MRQLFIILILEIIISGFSKQKDNFKEIEIVSYWWVYSKPEKSKDPYIFWKLYASIDSTGSCKMIKRNHKHTSTISIEYKTVKLDHKIFNELLSEIDNIKSDSILVQESCIYDGPEIIFYLYKNYNITKIKLIDVPGGSASSYVDFYHCIESLFNSEKSDIITDTLILTKKRDILMKKIYDTDFKLLPKEGKGRAKFKPPKIKDK